MTPPRRTAPMTVTRWLLCSWTKTATWGFCTNFCWSLVRISSSNPYIPAQEQPEHYLNNRFDIKSWLLTVDHKRIAVLYMISVTVFFVVGGIAAVLMRLEL